MVRRRLLSTCVVLGCLCLTGCFHAVNLEQNLAESLKGQGPVAIDSSNPYLATSVFLTKQSEQSPELKGFLNVVGLPSAIELSEGRFTSSALKLYYAAERRFYTVEQYQNSSLISGPFVIPQELLAKVGFTPAMAEAAPQPIVEEIRAPQKQAGALTREAPAPDALSTALPFKSPANRPIDPAFQEGAPVDKTMGSLNARSLQDAQQQQDALKDIVSRFAQSPAELSPKGDLVHYVTMSGETLSILSRWYTLDETNAGRLARINNIVDPQRLAPGDSVVVPSYLVQNKSRLNEEALREIQALIRR